MITHAQVEGGWTELKGKIKEHWGQLNDDELKEFQGDVDQLVGYLQRKTGETRAQVEEELKGLDERFGTMLDQLMGAARQYGQQVADAVGGVTESAREQIAAGHADAEQFVRQRPIESVAVAFGSGLIAGVIVGLLARSR